MARKRARRSSNRAYISVVVILLVFLSLGISALNQGYTGQLVGDRFTSEKQADQFAQCLTRQGWVMYGYYWSQSTQQQKSLFGNSFRFVNYVECDGRHQAGQPEVCQQVGVDSFVEWNRGSQSYTGPLGVEELAGLSGC